MLNLFGIFSGVSAERYPVQFFGAAIGAFFEVEDEEKGKVFDFTMEFYDPNEKMVFKAKDGSMPVPSNMDGNVLQTGLKIPGLTLEGPGTYTLKFQVGDHIYSTVLVAS